MDFKVKVPHLSKAIRDNISDLNSRRQRKARNNILKHIYNLDITDSLTCNDAAFTLKTQQAHTPETHYY